MTLIRRHQQRPLVTQPGRNGATFSEATIAGHVKRAKQLINHAVELGCISTNPFNKLKAGSQANDERKQYVPTVTIQKVIDAAPDAEWRLLIALVRYAGLRNPSESLRLRWSDIDWAEGRMNVTSPKTKRQGKAGRSVPIFAALRPFLEDAYEAADDGAEYCISRYRSQDINLRTGLERIIAKAHVTPWPRLWHNLRASAETDLVKSFPAHVAAAWLGHTPTVAVKHYLTVVDEDFERAANWSVNQVGQGVG
ncbi:MAG: site-specific integrase, partial [Planctomycetales bacterium]|nr:site-specific integrase [Planctomycetales bacterium]